MGAYERTGDRDLPAAAAAPAAAGGTEKPVFRVISLMLNKKTGGGRLLVEVPGAGNAVGDRERGQTGHGARRRRRAA